MLTIKPWGQTNIFPGIYKEEMPSPVLLTFQQTVEHLQALCDFGLFTNQPQFNASICQAEELLETEQCRI